MLAGQGIGDFVLGGHPDHIFKPADVTLVSAILEAVDFTIFLEDLLRGQDRLGVAPRGVLAPQRGR